MRLVFDSHGFVKRLSAAGMPEPQAEVLANEYTRWFEGGLAIKADLAILAKTTDLANLAEKADFANFAKAADLAPFAKTSDLSEFAKKVDLRELELRLEVRIEAAKFETLKWAFGAIGFQTIVLVGAIVALARTLH